MVLLAMSSAGTCSPASEAHPRFRSAYYLFLAGAPKGCEECYVPLLLTPEPLEQLTRSKKTEDCVLIITYERDSIWHDDGIVSVASADIDIAPRMIRRRNRQYRYQEIRREEVLKLLENPLGTIPISRPLLPKANIPGPGIEELISDFKKQD